MDAPAPTLLPDQIKRDGRDAFVDMANRHRAEFDSYYGPLMGGPERATTSAIAIWIYDTGKAPRFIAEIQALKRSLSQGLET